MRASQLAEPPFHGQFSGDTNVIEIPVHSPTRTAHFGAGSLRRAGFSLVELLVVIAIVVVLVGMSASMLSGPGSGANPRRAALLVSSAAMNARSQAMAAQKPARLLIDGEFDAAAPANYLRRVATVVRSDAGWTQRESAVRLPETTYLAVNYSSGLDDSMRYDFSVSSAQDGAQGGRVFFIEYDAAGRLAVPSVEEARLAFVSGILDPQSGGLTVPDARLPQRDGFIVRRAGRLTFFQHPDQITLAGTP